MYIREIFDQRQIYGEYHHLVLELRHCDPDYHFKYFRMTKASFDQILGLVYYRILHAPTHRRPIYSAERLAVPGYGWIDARDRLQLQNSPINSVGNTEGNAASPVGLPCSDSAPNTHSSRVGSN